MRKTLIALGLVTASIAAVPANAASFYLDLAPGKTAVAFGNSATTGGDFVDNFYFTADEGVANAFVSSLASLPSLDITIWRAFLDGTRFDRVATGGAFENNTLGATSLDARQHVVTVIGNWGKAGGSYNGVLSFDSAVPEPAAWTMMIAGFGLVGAALRSRRKTVAARFA
jgi:hypothetical protein